MIYQAGDIIGRKYRVQKILGQGGCGVVYLVASEEDGSVYALKTFLEETITKKTYERFKQEAAIWVELGGNPYIVHAYFVDEIEGRLFLAMEYIPASPNHPNSLHDYVQRGRIPLPQLLRWTIHICYGMEFATQRGIRSHRDLKPANIMIAPDNVAKITDFGLATQWGGIQHVATGWRTYDELRQTFFGQTMRGIGFGTPTHMPPEQFEDVASCDARSDIYSIGVILFQMMTGGKLPFRVPFPTDQTMESHYQFWKDMEMLHRNLTPPKLNSPLDPILQRCLHPEREQRYANFSALRYDLAQLLRKQTGEEIPPPPPKAMEAWDWINKGLSLQHLGNYEDAITAYDAALARNQRFFKPWLNKGICLVQLGRHADAMPCFTQAHTLEPLNPLPLTHLGNAYRTLGKHQDALAYYQRALDADPTFTDTWNERGAILHEFSYLDDALAHFDYALSLNPRHTGALLNKGTALLDKKRYADALATFEQAHHTNALLDEAYAGKGKALTHLRRFSEALGAFDHIIESSKASATIWTNRGVAYFHAEQYTPAERSFKQALSLDAHHAGALFNQGTLCYKLHRFDEASSYYRQALIQQPDDVGARTNLGTVLHHTHRYKKAYQAFDQALELRETDAKLWSNRACTLVYAKEYAAALQAFAKARHHAPDHADIVANHGVLHTLLGQYEEAAHCFDQALHLQPHSPRFWANQGAVCVLQGQISEALEAFRQAQSHATHHSTYWHQHQKNGSHPQVGLPTTFTASIDAFSTNPRTTLAHFQNTSHPFRTFYLLHPFVLFVHTARLV